MSSEPKTVFNDEQWDEKELKHDPYKVLQDDRKADPAKISKRKQVRKAPKANGLASFKTLEELQNEQDNRLTVDQFKRVLPPHMAKNLNQEVVDSVNNIIKDDESLVDFRDNLLGFSGVLKNPRFQLRNYIMAVKYVGYKCRGDTNIVAYMKTFPEKYQKFLDDGVSAKDINSYATAWNKSKLVTELYDQSMIPTYLLNADQYQKAVNVQADLMMNAKSEKVRSDAANSLLTHLKRPEAAKMELDIGIKESSAIDALREAVTAMSGQQRDMIRSGQYSAKEIAGTTLTIDGESTDD